MPKRKGKLRGTLPPEGCQISTGQALITAYTTQQGVPLSEAGRSPGPAGEVSLSPRSPFSPPKVDTPPGTEGLPIHLVEMEKGTPESEKPAVLIPTAGIPTAQIQRTGLQSLPEGNLVQSSEGESASSSSIQTLPLQRPANITLDSIWTVLESVYKLCSVTAANFVETTGEVKELKLIQQDHERRILTAEKEISTLNNTNLEVLKDRLMFLRKIENLENAHRLLTLRILNFPHSKTLLPKEMFNKYLIEILHYKENSLPILHQIYYLPIFKSVVKETSMDMTQETSTPLNVSEILEQSLEETVTKETLIVKFVFNMDKELLLKLYFKNYTVLFLGQQIRIFPDVSKTTQARRKKFLSMRNEALSIGAKFLLRFPCKCLLRYQNATFVFFEPTQLRDFLDSHRRTTSSPD